MPIRCASSNHSSRRKSAVSVSVFRSARRSWVGTMARWRSKTIRLGAQRLLFACRWSVKKGWVMSNNFSVFLIDDDPGVLKALKRLLSAKGYETKAFTSPKEFLASHNPAEPGCAVLDLAMPELDGLGVQDALAKQTADRQIIFLSGRADIPSTVRAMQAGAVDFLEKPINGHDLLSAVARAAERDGEARKIGHERHSIEERVKRLTPRELEVLCH